MREEMPQSQPFNACLFLLLAGICDTERQNAIVTLGRRGEDGGHKCEDDERRH